MKTIKSATFFLAIATLFACQKENIDPTYHSDPQAVKLTAAVGSPFTRSNPLGDGAASAAFNSGDQIAVSAGSQAAVQYTFNGTAWTPETGKYLKWETETMTFNAYYPVGVNNASMTGFVVPADQSTLPKLQQADYMTYTSPSPEAKAENISLTLTRKMARVVVGTTFNDQYITGYTVENIALHANTTGYTSGSVTSDDIDITSLKHTDGKFYALTSPTTVAPAATFFTVTVKKTADGSTETLTVKGIPTLEAGKSYAYTMKVGKNTLDVTNVRVSDWTTGGVIPGGEAEATIEVYPDANTIAVLKEGALKPGHITAALAGGTVLHVKGKLSGADITQLTAATTLTAINLSEVTYDGGTVPAADWSGCTNLTKILINTADATAYTTAWSSATDKLFYPGKELTYKVEAMTGDYAGGIPCVVIGITGFDTYRLISRNPYCGDTEASTDEIYLLKAGKAAGLKYNAMTAIITPWGSKVATLVDMEALVPLRPNSLTIITEEENGNQDIDLPSMLEDGFIVNSDGAPNLTVYTYDKGTKVFTLGYQRDTPDNFVNSKCAFITFDVTTP